MFKVEREGMKEREGIKELFLEILGTTLALLAICLKGSRTLPDL